MYSCAYSNIDNTSLINGYGAYSLRNAKIESINNLTVILQGFYSGYNLTINCQSDHDCQLRCFGNGCYNTLFICNINASCSILGGCEDDDSIDCPIFIDYNGNVSNTSIATYYHRLIDDADNINENINNDLLANGINLTAIIYYNSIDLSNIINNECDMNENSLNYDETEEGAQTMINNSYCQSNQTSTNRNNNHESISGPICCRAYQSCRTSTISQYAINWQYTYNYSYNDTKDWIWDANNTINGTNFTNITDYNYSYSYNESLTYTISNDNNNILVCSGANSCYGGDINLINGDAKVFCDGQESCQNATILFENGGTLYCGGWAACADGNFTNINSLYCDSGGRSCQNSYFWINSDVYVTGSGYHVMNNSAIITPGKAKQINIWLMSYQSGSGLSIYCNYTDSCFVYCGM